MLGYSSKTNPLPMSDRSSPSSPPRCPAVGARMRAATWGCGAARLIALVVAGLAAALPAAAQDARPLDPAARRTLRPAAARLAETPAATPTTARRGPTRADATGRVRADYRLDAAPLAFGPSPEATARAFLAARAARYGLGRDADAVLALDTVLAGASSFGATVRFEQVARLASGEALPVVGRGVSVTMDGAARVVMATSNVASVGAVVPPFRLSDDEAAERVRAEVLAVPGTVQVVRRAAFVGAGRDGVDAPVRPAFVVRATPTATGGVPVAWEAVVDGETGALLLLTERVAGHRRGGSAAAFVAEGGPGVGPRREATGEGVVGDGAEGRDVRARPLRAAATFADGSGLAFVPDPLTSAGAAYGVGGFVDGNDADTPDLSAQRREVALPGIALSGGRYTLVGPYVEITGEAIGGGAASVVPSEASPSGFRYPRSDPRFESVMAYHHIDASQRYVQRLALGRAIRERPVRVNPRGTSADDSYFAFDQNAVVFGTGGIDDAEDADVIWHEYGHVLLHDQTPGLFETFEARALHEGWSDFWAASYSHRLITEGRVPDHDWRRVYSWDGNNGCWQGRRLDHAGVYSPTDRSRMGYPARPGCAPFSTLYQWGLLWATTLGDIQADVGVEVSNRIVVASLAMLGGAAGPFPAAPPMEVAAEALLAADRALYGGAHESALVARLSARGFVDAGRFGPVVRHTPLASTEQSGGTRRIEVEAVGASSPVAAVRVVVRVDGGAAQTLALGSVAPTRYAGDLPIPTGPATVAYTIEATDAAGRTTRLPASADSAFVFAVGPDRTAPALAHTPRLTAPRGAFPLRVVATASDALGIDTVTVAYALERGGAAVRQGVAPLGRVAGTAATFVGTIPLAQSDVQVGDVARLHRPRARPRERSQRGDRRAFPRARRGRGRRGELRRRGRRGRRDGRRVAARRAGAGTRAGSCGPGRLLDRPRRAVPGHARHVGAHASAARPVVRRRDARVLAVARPRTRRRVPQRLRRRAGAGLDRQRTDVAPPRSRRVRPEPPGARRRHPRRPPDGWRAPRRPARRRRREPRLAAGDRGASGGPVGARALRPRHRRRQRLPGALRLRRLGARLDHRLDDRARASVRPDPRRRLRARDRRRPAPPFPSASPSRPPTAPSPPPPLCCAAREASCAATASASRRTPATSDASPDR